MPLSLPVTDLVTRTAIRFARADPTVVDTRRGSVGRWCDGVALAVAHRVAFAEYWHTGNQRARGGTGPIWVVLGDSTAQGLGAPSADGGYVGQVRAELVARTDRSWRVLNLSRSGATAGDVLHEQLPRLATLAVTPELVTCGVGANDVLATPPARLRATLRDLIAAVPDGTVVLDLPLPTRFWGPTGQLFQSYVGTINKTIHTAARHRGLPVAEVSAHFTPPWTGKFGPDRFHPSDTGYRDWAKALLHAIPDLPR
jgi:acyl-CoA thioesterase I